MYTIVAEEQDFIVISKRAGAHFHSQDGFPGVVATVQQEMGLRLYPVHRLDSVTSGLLLLARSGEAATALGMLFSKHQVQKYYLALAGGKPKKKQGWVIGDMAKSRRSKYKLLHSKGNPAITEFFSKSVLPGLRCYLLKPHSGKTHQIRVALASLGTPVLGDKLYGSNKADRTYLHAWQLEFTYNEVPHQYLIAPETGALFRQPELIEVLHQWRQPSALDWPGNKRQMRDHLRK